MRQAKISRARTKNNEGRYVHRKPFGVFLCLCYQSSQSPEMRDVEVCRDVRLQPRDLARQRQLVRADLLGFWCKEQVVVAVVGRNP